MSAYLGPNADQTNYESILSKLKDDVEQRIASYKDKQPTTQLLQLDFFVGSLLSLVGGGSGGSGGGGGTSAAVISAGVDDSVGIAAIVAELQSIVAGVEDSGASYWRYLSGYTEDGLSADTSSSSPLNLNGISTAIADEDLQATITIAPNPDVLTVFYGGTVAGLSESLAKALMNDAIRWGFDSSALADDEGESHSFAAGPLVITGRPNIVAFRALSTSPTFAPKLNIKFNQRVGA